MAMHLARAAGPQAKVLVDTGHHYSSQNIEQIVAWLLSENMLGGFHFNDRRYADDDLTLGSIDPYQVFRIFHEIGFFEWQTGSRADIAYMIDQSHNLKRKNCSPRLPWWITRVFRKRKPPPTSSEPSPVFKMRSRPTSARRSGSGDRPKVSRRIQWRRSAEAAIWIASHGNEPAAKSATRPPTPDPS
jgi:hypothetical protein